MNIAHILGFSPACVKSVFIQVALFRKFFITYKTDMMYFTYLCHMMDFTDGVFKKHLSFITPKYEAFSLHVSGHAFLGDL